MIVLLALAGCGEPTAPRFEGDSPSPVVAFGNCAFCHAPLAEALVPVSDELKCALCHADAMPGRVGPGHRGVPGAELVPAFVGASHQLGELGPFGSCSLCHATVATQILPVGEELLCRDCHEAGTVSGYGPGHQARPGTDRVPSPPVAVHAAGEESIYGSCALCHNQITLNLLAAGNGLDCAICHEATGSDAYGPGHQTVPGEELVPSFVGVSHAVGEEGRFGSCAFCHASVSTQLLPLAEELECGDCHAAGSVAGFGPGHQSRPGRDLVPSPSAAVHAAGDEAVYGSCALCHNEITRNLLAETNGLVCSTCHENAGSGGFGPDHQTVPGPELVPSFVGVAHRSGPEGRFGSCAFCHNDTTRRGLTERHGRLELECANCHEEAIANVWGPGHQEVARCVTCHPGRWKSHGDPAEGTDRECAVCHDAHGSSNLFLIRQFILTPTGPRGPVLFTSLLGLADGSFASASQPGQGVCEVCHEETRYFRRDGQGEAHVPFACFTCHPHQLGFEARP